MKRLQYTAVRPDRQANNRGQNSLLYWPDGERTLVMREADCFDGAGEYLVADGGSVALRHLMVPSGGVLAQAVGEHRAI